MTRSRLTPLKAAVDAAVAQEGLRPFSERAGLPLGVVRSVQAGRNIKADSIERLSKTLGLEFYIGPPRHDSGENYDGSVDYSGRPRARLRPTLSPALRKALDLPDDATEDDALARIRAFPTTAHRAVRVAAAEAARRARVAADLELLARRASELARELRQPTEVPDDDALHEPPAPFPGTEKD